MASTYEYPVIHLNLPATEAGITLTSSQFDMEEDEHLEAILESIVDERWRQDEQWGGPEHDDQHPPKEWQAILLDQVETMLTRQGEASDRYRDRLVATAAVCVAAIQAWDRQAHRPGEAGEHVHPEPVEG